MEHESDPPSDGHPEWEDECFICMHKLPSPATTLLPCGYHIGCGPCIKDMFAAALHSELSYPPSCCSLVPNISVISVEHLLDSSFIEEYKTKQLEYETDPRSRIYCANPQCSSFLPREVEPGTAEESNIHCTECGTRTCTGCKGIFDIAENHTCERPTLDLGYNEDNRSKPCPYCKTPVELSEACNHLRCTVCRYEFCFVCLQWWYPPGGIIHPCPQYGDPEYDENGYDQYGLHRDTGLDREGYDLAGYNVDHVNRKGERRAVVPVPGSVTELEHARNDGWGPEANWNPEANVADWNQGNGGQWDEGDGQQWDQGDGQQWDQGDEEQDEDLDDEEARAAGLDDDDFEEDRIVRRIRALELNITANGADYELDWEQETDAQSNGQPDGQVAEDQTAADQATGQTAEW